MRRIITILVVLTLFVGIFVGKVYATNKNIINTKEEERNILDIPIYFQQDGLWAYTSTGSGSLLAKTGCGQCSAALTATILTGEEVLPSEFAEYGTKKGTSSSNFPKMFEKYNLPVRYCYNANVARSEVEEKGAIIISKQLGRNHSVLTKGGHYITIIGFDGDEVIIRDSNVYGKANEILKIKPDGTYHEGISELLSKEELDEISRFPWRTIAHGSSVMTLVYPEGTKLPTQEELNKEWKKIPSYIP